MADDQNQAAGNAPNMGDQIVATVQQDSQIYVDTNTNGLCIHSLTTHRYNHQYLVFLLLTGGTL